MCAQVVKRVGSLKSLPRPTNTRDIFTHTRDRSSAQRTGLAECAQGRFRWSACDLTLECLKTKRRISVFLHLSNRSLFYLCRNVICFVETPSSGVARRHRSLSPPFAQRDPVRQCGWLETLESKVKLETKALKVKESRESKQLSYLKKEKKEINLSSILQRLHFTD